MLSERIIQLIAKRHKGTCSPLEMQELEDWYASFGHLEPEIEDKLSADVTETELMKSSILSGIHKQLKKSDIEEGKVSERPFQPVRRWWRQSLAACVLILLLGSIVFYKNPLKPGTVTVSTKTDETTRIVLPDSSVVWLKPGSRIRYDRKLGKGAVRELFLVGEGFFDIAHHASRPFIVHTRYLNINVLGTVFNVRSHSKDQVVETTLFKGSVRIDREDDSEDPVGDSVTLIPNQRAVYSTGSRLMTVSNLYEETETRTEHKHKSNVPMIFDEKPFDELLAHIEKKFGVSIYIHNRSLQKCLVTADLEKESLSEILNLLKISYGINYSMYGKDLFIEGAICDR